MPAYNMYYIPSDGFHRNITGNRNEEIVGNCSTLISMNMMDNSIDTAVF